MLKRNLIATAMLSLAFIFVGNPQAQRHPDVDAKSKASKPRVKAKPKTVTTAHDRYANQEVSYRKSAGNEVAKNRKKATTNVWGDPHVNERSNVKIAKPHENPAKPKQTQASQIFMEGGNDSWNTRKKPARRKSSRCMSPICGGKTSTVK